MLLFLPKLFLILTLLWLNKLFSIIPAFLLVVLLLNIFLSFLSELFDFDEEEEELSKFELESFELSMSSLDEFSEK